jgi:hypothetical protein
MTNIGCAVVESSWSRLIVQEAVHMDGEGFIPEFAGSFIIALGFQTHCFAGSYIPKGMKDPSKSAD